VYRSCQCYSTGKSVGRAVCRIADFGLKLMGEPKRDVTISAEFSVPATAVRARQSGDAAPPNIGLLDQQQPIRLWALH
jgi:hypothetical protein